MLKNQFKNTLWFIISVIPVIAIEPGHPRTILGDSACMEALKNFANFSANFTYCAIANARPIKLCGECVGGYLNLISVYNDILKYSESGGVMCKDELFNLDRLQVVSSGHNYITGLWKRANCDTCFQSDGEDGLVLTDPVKQILATSVILDNCIKNHTNESGIAEPDVCQQCNKFYVEINTIYNNIKADTGGINFCMDIVDLINSTRSSWSIDLGCSRDRKKPEITFLLNCTGIAITTILFYFAVYAFTKRKEHPVIHPNRWSLQRSPSPGLSTS